MSKVRYIITCEHGGNEVPREYEYVFNKQAQVLDTHRAYDIGALDLFRHLTEAKCHASFFSTTTRLLVELNRSRNHKALFSEFTKPLSKIVRRHILNKYYTPYRNVVYTWIYKWISKGFQVVHISVHTFTPVLDGVERNVDIGLLFDPSRKMEMDFCTRWKELLTRQAPDLAIEFNKPYLGKSDGFTTFLRKEFDADSYLGIEIEINQKHFLNNAGKWPAIITDTLTHSYREAVKVLD